MKMKVEIIKWGGELYSAYMRVRGGSLETGNHKSAALAKRAFVDMCNRLGVDKSKYQFEDKVKDWFRR